MNPALWILLAAVVALCHSAPSTTNEPSDDPTTPTPTEATFEITGTEPAVDPDASTQPPEPAQPAEFDVNVETTTAGLILVTEAADEPESVGAESQDVAITTELPESTSTDSTTTEATTTEPTVTAFQLLVETTTASATTPKKIKKPVAALQQRPRPPTRRTTTQKPSGTTLEGSTKVLFINAVTTESSVPASSRGPNPFRPRPQRTTTQKPSGTTLEGSTKILHVNAVTTESSVPTSSRVPKPVPSRPIVKPNRPGPIKGIRTTPVPSTTPAVTESE